MNLNEYRFIVVVDTYPSVRVRNVHPFRRDQSVQETIGVIAEFELMRIVQENPGWGQRIEFQGEGENLRCSIVTTKWISLTEFEACTIFVAPLRGAQTTALASPFLEPTPAALEALRSQEEQDQAQQQDAVQQINEGLEPEEKEDWGS